MPYEISQKASREEVNSLIKEHERIISEAKDRIVDGLTKSSFSFWNLGYTTVLSSFIKDKSVLDILIITDEKSRMEELDNAIRNIGFLMKAEPNKGLMDQLDNLEKLRTFLKTNTDDMHKDLGTLQHRAYAKDRNSDFDAIRQASEALDELHKAQKAFEVLSTKPQEIPDIYSAVDDTLDVADILNASEAIEMAYTDDKTTRVKLLQQKIEALQKAKDKVMKAERPIEDEIQKLEQEISDYRVSGYDELISADKEKIAKDRKKLDPLLKKQERIEAQIDALARFKESIEQAIHNENNDKIFGELDDTCAKQKDERDNAAANKKQSDAALKALKAEVPDLANILTQNAVEILATDTKKEQKELLKEKLEVLEDAKSEVAQIASKLEAEIQRIPEDLEYFRQGDYAEGFTKDLETQLVQKKKELKAAKEKESNIDKEVVALQDLGRKIDSHNVEVKEQVKTLKENLDVVKENIEAEKKLSEADYALKIADAKAKIIKLTPDLIHMFNTLVKDPSKFQLIRTLEMVEGESKVAWMARVGKHLVQNIGVTRDVPLALVKSLWTVVKIYRDLPTIIEHNVDRDKTKPVTIDDILQAPVVMEALRDTEFFKILANERGNISLVMRAFQNDIATLLSARPDPYAETSDSPSPVTILKLIHSFTQNMDNFQNLLMLRECIVNELIYQLNNPNGAYSEFFERLGISSPEKLTQSIESMNSILGVISDHTIEIHNISSILLTCAEDGELQIDSGAAKQTWEQISKIMLDPNMTKALKSIVSPANLKSIATAMASKETPLGRLLLSLDFDKLASDKLIDSINNIVTSIGELTHQQVEALLKARDGIENLSEEEQHLLIDASLKVAADSKISAILQDNGFKLLLKSEKVRDYLEEVMQEAEEANKTVKKEVVQFIHDVLPAVAGLASIIFANNTINEIWRPIIPQVISVMNDPQNLDIQALAGAFHAFLSNNEVQSHYGEIAEKIAKNKNGIQLKVKEIINASASLRRLNLQDQHLSTLIDVAAKKELVPHVAKICEKCSKREYIKAGIYAAKNLGLTKPVLQAAVSIAKEAMIPGFVKRMCAGKLINQIIFNPENKDLADACKNANASGISKILLRGHNLSKQNIKASLSGKTVSGFDFSGSNFKGDGLKMDGAIISGCDFSGIAVNKRGLFDRVKNKETGFLSLNNATIDASSLESLLPAIKAGKVMAKDLKISVANNKEFETLSHSLNGTALQGQISIAKMSRAESHKSERSHTAQDRFV